MSPVEVRSAREIAGMRLVAQGLVGPPLGDAAAVVRHLTCLQAQNLLAAREAVAVRTSGRALAEVDAALADGRIVRSWPMRGTLHLAPAEDLGWMLALTRDGVHRAARRRHEELGLTEPLYRRAAEVCRDALRGRGLTRSQLVALWREAGLELSGQLVSHVVGTLCRDGVLVFGPMAGRDQQLRLTAEWIPRTRRLRGAEAIREWVRRYVVSHGPATLADFCWWTKLPVRAVRTALAELGKELAPVRARLDGEELDLWCAPDLPDRYADLRRRTAAPLLTPAFDEILLGYADRRATLPAPYADRVVPGGNGMFLPVVLHRATAVGTWRRPRRAAHGPEVTPFDGVPPPVERALPRLWSAWPG